MSERRSRRPTIYDIAKASRSSPTTVSLVLNDRWSEQRIKPATAERILECAGRLGYAVNLNARGLRLSRSGLGGMILPHYRNRFFAGLAEAFEAAARARGLCPIVVSTQRDPTIELEVAETLLAQQIEFLFIAGVRDPAPLNALCRAADIRSINVDLPGPDAPSVMSDNLAGGRALTATLVEKLRAHSRPLDDWLFFGGVADDNSTASRVAGFTEVLTAAGAPPPPEAFDCCGYQPEAAARALAARHARLGRLPAGLFANGLPALEGMLSFASTLAPDAFDATVVGAFDWDPFAAHLPFDLTMVRQDVDAMIAAAFALLDDWRPDARPVVTIAPSIGKAHLVPVEGSG